MQTITIHLGNDKYLNVTEDDYPAFSKLYRKAIADNKDQLIYNNYIIPMDTAKLVMDLFKDIAGAPIVVAGSLPAMPDMR